jgi:hypothetical protein
VTHLLIALHPLHVLMAGITVTPNSSLPGTSMVQTAVGGLITVVEYLLLGSLVIAALSWAWGSHSGNTNLAYRGRSALFYVLFAAVVVGASNALINFALSTNIGLA